MIQYYCNTRLMTKIRSVIYLAALLTFLLIINISSHLDLQSSSSNTINSNSNSCATGVRQPSSIFVRGLTQNEHNQRSKLTLESHSRRRHLFQSAIVNHFDNYLIDENSNGDDDKDDNGNFIEDSSMVGNGECLYFNRAKKKDIIDNNLSIHTGNDGDDDDNGDDNGDDNDSANDDDEWIMSHWTIEYCPQKSIRMMNLTPFIKTSNGTNNNNNNKGNKAPKRRSSITTLITIDSQRYIMNEVHSLGHYLNPTSMSEKDFDLEIYKIWGSYYNKSDGISYYTKGDTCQSPSSTFQINRATKVHTILRPVCPDVTSATPTNNFFTYQQSQQTASKNGYENSIVIEDVTETSKCRYSISICHAVQSITTDDDDDYYDDDDEIVKNEEYGDDGIIDLKHQQQEDEYQDQIKNKRSIIDHYTHVPDNDNTFKSSPTSSISNNKSYYEHLQEMSSKSFPPMPSSRIESNKALLKSMFYHAYDSYMYNAYPSSELKPKSCTGGKFHLVRLPALTLIDTLDTLIIMGNYTEFGRSVERLRALDLEMKANPIWKNSNEVGGLFAVNQNVSVFETNIRVLGGLLSAHQMAEAWVDGKVLRDDVFSKSEDGGVLIGEVAKRVVVEAEENERSNDDNADGMIQNLDVDAKVLNECTAEGLSAKAGENEQSCSTNHQKGKTSTKNNATSTSSNFWQYDGVLLSLAYDIGRRLLPAFESKTGIPYGTVNLLYGVPHEETQIASLAGAGSLSIEMELLSRLSGDQSFGKAAKLATRALWMRKSKDKMLLGKHIDIESGAWKETLSGVGSNSDSFYEYLLKHYILYPEDNDFFDMFRSTYYGIFHNARQGDWYPNDDMNDGFSLRSKVFESLAAFYPGMQVLLGELTPATRSENGFTSVREHLGFLPERFDFSTWSVLRDHSHHPLRPEIHESCYFLHMATKDMKVSYMRSTADSASGWLWSADFAIHELEKLTKTHCGYGVVDSVSPDIATESLEKGMLTFDILQDEMPSFFLSETLKYFYLAFDADNMINTDKERNWIFTTEAHPIHHVPLVDSKQSANKSKRKLLHDVIRNKITNKLKMKATKHNNNKREKETLNDSINTVLNPKTTITVTDQIWSRLTSRYEYIRDIKQVNVDSIATGRSKQLFGRVVRGNETSDINFATIEHEKNGRGSSLKKSCPNFHHSNALWIHALTGDQILYTDLFSSRFSDEEDEQNEEKLFSALISSALLGLSYEEKAKNVCSLYERNKNTNEDIHSQSTNSAPLGSQRIDMGQLGLFDISVYNGEGFYIKHVASGESVEATIIDQQGDQEPFIAIEAYVPAKVGERKTKGLLLKSLGSSFSKLKSVFVRKKDIMMYPSKLHEKYDRKVLISDMYNTAFSCSVEVIQAFGPFKEKGNDSSSDVNNVVYRNKKVVDSFPCLPATYGPTALKILREEKNQRYEATLHAPDQTDPFGCEKGEEYTDNIDDEEQSRIDLVERGICNFRSKAMNIRSRTNAEAVIIINTEGDKLFVMAGPKEGDIDYTDEPASILVTKADGEEMIRILNEKNSNNNKKFQILSRINIQSQPQTVDTTNPVWPHLITETDSIQVLASQGWGITAKKENGQWAIYILQHDGKPS